ncbi:MAG TPA: transglycosylase SLT domain-containing protein [Gemmatimonadaceae bacterium]
MDRDQHRVMFGALLHTVVLATTLACQQGERRESPGEVAATLPARPTPVPTPDADVRAAQIELAEGRAWLATRKVAPVLRVPARRSPEAVLVAARAASGWGGWDEVQKLLASEPWLASRFSGEGLELLARSALERGDAAEARAHAEAALRVSAEPSARALRLVLLARALDRLDVRDSAAATYWRAAEALPLAREWLVLRAAGATEEARARARMYATIRNPVARARVGYTEAQTLERFKMLLAAAAAYDSVGDQPSAFRLRLSATKDEAQRTQLRTGLLEYIEKQAPGSDLEHAIEVLDSAYSQLDTPSALLIARRAAAGGLQARAVAGFSKVPAATLTDSDVIAWARALVATGKSGQAASLIASHTFDAAAAPEAEYVRAHALLRAGQGLAARSALQRLIATRASTPQAADALYLLADLESDAGNDTSARDLHQRSCTHAPAGSFSDEACFRAGIISFVLGDARRAATTFDEISKRFPNSSELLAASYWAGRSWLKAGNAALARERWRSAMAREPNSYYGSAGAKRLGVAPFSPKAAEIPRSPAFQTKLARAAVLEHLGMDTEERYEYDAIETDASAAPAAALGAGALLIDRGQVPRGIRLGWRAIAAARDAGKTDLRGYSLAYPLLRRDALTSQARANNLDPALVAGVIRQESSWNPRAVSRAGARGWMQVMPNVGKEIALARRYPVWDPALLFDPDVSLEMGTSHLRGALSHYNNLPRALAAYNAGESRVRRWVQRAGADDPEVFIERIPFVETRDYVRIVMRNAEVYRSLYGLRK